MNQRKWINAVAAGITGLTMAAGLAGLATPANAGSAGPVKTAHTMGFWYLEGIYPGPSNTACMVAGQRGKDQRQWRAFYCKDKGHWELWVFD